MKRFQLKKIIWSKEASEYFENGGSLWGKPGDLKALIVTSAAASSMLDEGVVVATADLCDTHKRGIPLLGPCPECDALPPLSPGEGWRFPWE